MTIYQRLLQYYLNSERHFIMYIDYFFETFDHIGRCGEKNYLFYSAVYKDLNQKEMSEHGYKLLLSDDLIKKYYNAKYTDLQIFSIIFGAWCGITSEQIDFIAKQKSDGSALNALNYFLCNPKSKFSALSDEILSSFHFFGDYYVEVSNETIKARYTNGTLISTDDNKIFEIS